MFHVYADPSVSSSLEGRSWCGILIVLHFLYLSHMHIFLAHKFQLRGLGPYDFKVKGSGVHVFLVKREKMQ